MAGSEQPQNPNEAAPEPMNKGLWQIHYSCFFSFPFFPSTCHILKPLTSSCINRNPCGRWVSYSSMAFLHLISDYRVRGVVLIVSFHGIVYEEHQISNLVFSWPQVSCLEERPVRGSIVVFSSYRDSLGQVQKFAMYFSSSSDSQTFINSLKVPVEILSNVNPNGNYEPIAQLISGHESIKHICSKEPMLAHGLDATCASLPPSFIALLFDSCPQAEEDMLRKLEMVIGELGGDLAL
ncbi:protein POOR HOMOLOGOUS SYNAPSIS 1 isoform X2 [Hevea brasiliensis]|uniref:protein POOR HOMOLOGOUS SYNAPSIS 1 isoform X2 n=1 Tax=Hevea brasiliensis TaxID=3981 RepID=UPI0025FF64DD|nr:protein POOR HOMOLOGOUS SYNAPSIS 1 isoform X2 [Hevea brasiliensis]